MYLLLVFQPPDSEHPDRFAQQEVYVEKWLTVKEYTLAHSRRILVGQETRKERLDKAILLADKLTTEYDEWQVRIFPSSSCC